MVGRRAGGRTIVAAGSVWESRMKHDEVRGGIKVFNGEENSDEGNGIVGGTKSKRGQTVGVGTVSTGKRKTWKSETLEGIEKNPIQIAKGKTEPQRNFEEQCKELSVSVDGLKKSPIQVRKLRSEGSKEIIVAPDKAERSPVGMRKPRSELLKSPVGSSKAACVSGEGIQRNSVQLRKGKSDSIKVLGQSDKDNDGSNGAIQLSKVKSEPSKALVESEKGNDVAIEEIEKNSDDIGNDGSDETCREFGVCQEKVISSCESNVGVPNTAPKAIVHEDDDDQEDEEEEPVVDEIEVEVEKKSLDIKEINVPEKKPSKIINEEKVVNEVKKPHFERKEIRKFHQVHQKSEPISLNVKKQPPVIKRATLHTNFAKPACKNFLCSLLHCIISLFIVLVGNVSFVFTDKHLTTSIVPASNGYHSFPERHNRLQSFGEFCFLNLDVANSFCKNYCDLGLELSSVL